MFKSEIKKPLLQSAAVIALGLICFGFVVSSGSHTFFGALWAIILGILYTILYAIGLTIGVVFCIAFLFAIFLHLVARPVKKTSLNQSPSQHHFYCYFLPSLYN